LNPAHSSHPIARVIDHTLLKPEATKEQVRQLCHEATEYGFASVCVNPTYVRFAAKLLRASGIKVCTVVGFPLGAHTTEVKATEALCAIREGAKEIDMVINIGALKNEDEMLLYEDILTVVNACHEGGALCKVIIETALLSDEEKVRACETIKKAHADFVKTSTGFGQGGATERDVRLMAEAVRGTSMGVKASGGIRTLADVQKMLNAGATRIGTSSGVQIMKEVNESKDT
jgi:deoxyribose-phosphate aldolase